MPSAAQIPLAMLLVFASAKLLAEIFERLGQPGIVGEILAGVLIGPQVLGWLAPSELLGTLSDLGVMFLLFRVGLEVKASELMKVGGTAVLVAVGGVIVPFFAGWGICALWGEPRLESVFTGAAMVATSVGITAQVLASRGLLDMRASRIILAAAVVDDVLGLIVLALVSGMAKGAVNYLDIALTAGLALGFTFFVARFGTRTVRRVMPRVQARIAPGGERVRLGHDAAVCALPARRVCGRGGHRRRLSGRHGVVGDRRGTRSPTSPMASPSCWCRSFWSASVCTSISRRLPAPARWRWRGALLVAAVLSKFVACGAGALGMGRTDAIRVGSRHGAARRGRDGGGADRTQPRRHRAQHLRHHRLHVGGHHADRTAAVEDGLRLADGSGTGNRPPGLTRCAQFGHARDCAWSSRSVTISET